MKNKVDLILPAHNEEGNIRPIYEEIKTVMQASDYDFHIFFVDDGSIDQTENILRTYAKHKKQINYYKKKLDAIDGVKKGSEEAKKDLLPSEIS